MTTPIFGDIPSRQVIGQYLNIDGTPVVGEVSFLIPVPWRDDAGNVTLVPSKIDVPLNADGTFSIMLPTTDFAGVEDPDVPAITVQEPGSHKCWSFVLPLGDGSPIDILDVTHAVIVPPEQIGIAFTGLGIGTVETLPSGSLATASITGSAPEPDLNLGIPRGDRPTVEFGTITSLPPGSTPTATWTGTGSVVDPYVLSMEVIQGIQGVQGPANNIGIGTVTTGPAGGTAAASVTGVYPNQKLNLTLPRGELTNLTIGTVTTGAPGTNATATITGTAPNRVLNLTIPRGDTGNASDTINDAATNLTSTWSSSKIRATISGGKGLFIGPLTECVIVGSSNAVSGTWDTKFCADWGLTKRNYAIGGSGYTNANNFLAQLQSAAADTAFANTDVAVVVIADASNNIRSNNDAGAWYPINSEASATFDYARTTFPNARILCLPVIWPADPLNQASGVPGGYQKVWRTALRARAEEMRVAAAVHGVEMVEDSWTWLTGLTGVMETSGGVHPNAAGYALIAQWLGKHVRGEVTRRDTAWVDMSYVNAVPLPGERRLQVMREGWDVKVAGTVRISSASSGYTDFATMPLGFRPPDAAEFSLRQNGTAINLAAQVYSSGTIRLWQGFAANTEFFIGGGYSIG